ncbi:hypothetical protein BH23PLA1_BH23PLA1_45010 [soil metagenome]
MSKDINKILEGWDHDPEELQVRIVRGDDGTEKLQMRLDLGLLQMELEGRPDGRRPQGAESWLDHHEAQARAAEPQEADYPLESDACAELLREGLQYYHRYLALFHLGRYDLVARDTTRNLRLFAFVRRHATRMRDKLQFDQYRPYVTMMHARAVGQQAIERGDHKSAIERIDQAIAAIRDFLREYDQQGREATCQELAFLKQWRVEVERERTIGPVERLEEQLQHAVALEDYEEAARLRDQLRRLQEATSSPRLPSRNA